ncbi:MAG: Rossmann-like domain-containing protein [Halodesulfurarchaeum sp.]
MTEAPTAGRILAARLDAIDDPGDRIRGVAVGDELVIVETESGHAGVAMCPEATVPPVDGESAFAVAARGAASEEPARRAVGLAALNAIDPPDRIRPGLDPFRRLDPSVERVAMVGLFAPVLKRLDAAHVDVFERDPAAMTVPADLATGLDVTLHSPQEAVDSLPGAEVVYVTGSTLVWGGIETYLRAARPEQTIVLVGASASFTPDPLFEAGISVVAGASVQDPTAVRRAIADDQSEADLHDGRLEKWGVVDPDLADVPGLDLD